MTRKLAVWRQQGANGMTRTAKNSWRGWPPWDLATLGVGHLGSWPPWDLATFGLGRLGTWPPW